MKALTIIVNDCETTPSRKSSQSIHSLSSQTPVRLPFRHVPSSLRFCQQTPSNIRCVRAGVVGAFESSLYNNQIGDSGATSLAGAIKVNASLTWLK